MIAVAALAVLLCIYAAGELIAQKTKTIFSSVLSMAILLLAGFWSGLLPDTIIGDAQITGFGNVIAGLLIVSLGTTIDFQELKQQWRVVVTAFLCVCGAVLVIILVGIPTMCPQMALSSAPIFAGGSAATLIMTTALNEKGLALASTFCIVLYVTQKFIGVPIASLLLRRTARQFIQRPKLVAQYGSQTETQTFSSGGHRRPLQLPPPLRPALGLPGQAGPGGGGRPLRLRPHRRRHPLLCHVPGDGRPLLRPGLPGQEHSEQDPVFRTHHLLCHHPHLLQPG